MRVRLKSSWHWSATLVRLYPVFRNEDTVGNRKENKKGEWNAPTVIAACKRNELQYCCQQKVSVVGLLHSCWHVCRDIVEYVWGLGFWQPWRTLSLERQRELTQSSPDQKTEQYCAAVQVLNNVQWSCQN